MASIGDSRPRKVWSWGASFYLIPIACACIMTSICLSRGIKLLRSDFSSLVMGWTIGVPIGLAAWIMLWMVAGARTGVPELWVIVSASALWAGLCLSLNIARRDRFISGMSYYAAVVLAMVLIRFVLSPQGTGLIALELVAALGLPVVLIGLRLFPIRVQFSALYMNGAGI